MIISRPGKVAGGTSVVTGGTIYAQDWNGDIDAIVNVVNGQISDDNVDNAAAIDTTKIDDYSATSTQANTITDPGTTDAISAATTLAGEIERLRYNDLSLGLGATAIYHNGTTNAVIGPYDGTIVGNNLVVNGSLQIQTLGTPYAPDAWTAVNSPSAVTLFAGAGSDDGEDYACKVVSSGGAAGISQLIRGIKPNTLYLFGCRARAGVAAGSMAVSGGKSSGAFMNTSRSIAVHATNYTTYILAVKSDASGSTMTLAILSGTTAVDEINIHDVWAFEVSKEPRSYGNTGVLRQPYFTGDDTILGAGSGNWIAAPSGSSCVVRPFRNGQRIQYNATIAVRSPIAGSSPARLIRFKRASTVISGPFAMEGNVVYAFHFFDTFDTGVPGTAITYSYEVYDDVLFVDYVFNPLVGSVQSSSIIVVSVGG